MDGHDVHGWLLTGSTRGRPGRPDHRQPRPVLGHGIRVAVFRPPTTNHRDLDHHRLPIRQTSHRASSNVTT